MPTELGEVVGWMGKELAIVILFGTGLFVFVLKLNEKFVHADTGTYWTTVVVGCVSAAVVFLIGQALRRILIASDNSTRDSRSDQRI
jgi:hypothetical protein